MAATRIKTQDIADDAITTAKILNEAVTFAKLDLAATNPGLEDNTGIQVKVDDTTIERAGSGLQVKDAGISLAKLGALTTKGDLLTWSTTHARLPVGTDGQYLTAASGETTGLLWATFSGLAASNFVSNETPTGTIDGVNDDFTLANTPTAGTLKLYKNGMRQRSGAGNDFTITGDTITFEAGNLPQTGDVLLADYQK